jgi:DNA processing protein
LKEELAYWIALSQLRDIGPVRFFKLYERYQSIEKIYKFTAEDLNGLRLSTEKINAIISARSAISPQAELDKVRKAGITPISFWSGDYPPLLREIYAPPFLLYTLGNKELLKTASWLAIVGTRHPSPYGLKMTARLTAELVRNGWGIVSGLAKGIDAEAHTVALEQGGKTIAVLGCGIDYIYPYENKGLYQAIKEKGLIISEMPLGVTPQPFQFPLRNRIVTGLAKGTLVIEGDFKSGAMISGKLALDQNREVFALPGRVTDTLSNGPNWLIKQGAVPVSSVDDILEVVGGKTAFSGQRSAVMSKNTVHRTQHTEARNMGLMQERFLNRQDIKKGGKNIKDIQLNFTEEKVYRELSDEDSISIDVLTEKTGLTISELMMVLSGLELQGLARQLPGKQFLRIS